MGLGVSYERSTPAQEGGVFSEMRGLGSWGSGTPRGPPGYLAHKEPPPLLRTTVGLGLLQDPRCVWVRGLMVEG